MCSPPCDGSSSVMKTTDEAHIGLWLNPSRNMPVASSFTATYVSGVARVGPTPNVWSLVSVM